MVHTNNMEFTHTQPDLPTAGQTSVTVPFYPPSSFSNPFPDSPLPPPIPALDLTVLVGLVITIGTSGYLDLVLSQCFMDL